jgi:hypothetical protein
MLPAGTVSVNRQRRPVSRWRNNVQARPGVASGPNGAPRRRSRRASAASAVSGRNRGGMRGLSDTTTRPFGARPRRARLPAAYSVPAISRNSGGSESRSRAANPNSVTPLPTVTSGSGFSWSKVAHPASTCASSVPLMPRGSSSLAAACSRGSAGALPASSSSSRSRHHASLIAASVGSVERATTSAIASSMSNRASKAGRSSTGQ